jgi:hypothetical protein
MIGKPAEIEQLHTILYFVYETCNLIVMEKKQPFNTLSKYDNDRTNFIVYFNNVYLFSFIY